MENEVENEVENEWRTAIRERRYGKFFIGDRYIQGNPDVVQKLLSTVLVMTSRFSYVSQSIEYMALAPIFAPVEDGMEAPEYQVIYSFSPDTPVELTLETL